MFMRPAPWMKRQAGFGSDVLPPITLHVTGFFIPHAAIA
ncbi:hypothetical protein SZ54_3773 [Rhizobium sp. UR51a]|nr:hypothetical protein SZ54_3773 [Rhizobium sp. UR51a]